MTIIPLRDNRGRARKILASFILIVIGSFVCFLMGGLFGFSRGRFQPE